MNATEVITTTFGGQTFRAGRRTAAHLQATQDRLSKRHPGAWVRVIQPCYNTGVDESAGTHDLDAVLDVEVVGLGWWDAQRFLRANGWAAWYRYPPLFGEHIHMISLGYGNAPVGIYVPGQVQDYYNHAQGLAGRHEPGSDPTWHPADVDSTIFDYAAWLDQENDVNLSDDIYGDPDKTLTVGQLYKKLDAFMGREDERAKATKERLAVLRSSLSELADRPEGATKAEVKALLNNLDATIQIVVADPETTA